MTTAPAPAHRREYLTRALDDGHAALSGAGRSERIRYRAADHSERWGDPEEKVRAELWAELIYQYGYPPARIAFEVTLPDRTPTRYADLVIYADDGRKDPYFVFECKSPNLSDAEFDQAVEQAVGNRNLLGARYCGAVSGLTRRLLRFDNFPPGERDRNRMADIPARYNRPPEWRFYKTDPAMGAAAATGPDLAGVSREELRAAIRKCHQTLWEGGRRSPIAAFGEFSKLVFVKHRDEKRPRPSCRPALRLPKPRRRNRRRPGRPHQPAFTIKSRALEPEVFTDPINVAPPILKQCVEHLEGISLDRTELDTKGVAFEEFMGSFFKGDFGQYFTPRELIAFCVAALEPKRNDLILDPACGSGGFLLYALDYVRRQADERQTPGTIAHFRYWNEFAEKNLFGLEINDVLARVAKMNMIIQADCHTNIVGHDALDFADNIRSKNQAIAPGSFDLILTNPPFGATIRRAEKGDGYLEQFRLIRYLGKDYPLHTEMTGAGDETDTRLTPRQFRPRANIKTEIAFLERIHTFLKPGAGRAAVVLPDGILTNSSLAGVRHWLLAHFQLLGVVSLPQFAFSHYNAGVKASIVLLRRLAEGETVPEDTPIFMALAENIGYDATGRKTFTITPLEEILGVSKDERHSCDLFDYRVTYEWSQAADEGRGGWSEQRREVIAGTGLAGQWADFQKDPTPFLANPAVRPGEAGCFAVRFSAVQQRADPAFHATPDLAAVVKARHSDTQTIAELSEFIDSGRLIAQRRDDHGIPAYEVGHILPCELKDTDVFVLPDTDKVLERHDLITGRVGGIGVVAEYQSDQPASFSDNVLRIRLTERNKARAAFIAEYLNSSIGNTQLLRGGRGSLQKVVTQQSLKEIVVPLLGDLETEIIAAMDAARAERKANLAEADTLLAGVDDYLLDTLGITPPPADTRRVFAVSLAQMQSSGRIDSDYYHPERLRALRLLDTVPPGLTVSRLADAVSFERDQIAAAGDNYLGMAQVSSHTGELTDTTDTASGKCYVFQPDDVLFSRMAPALNKVYCAAMSGYCTTEFHVLRVNDPAALLPEYLAAILRSRLIRAQTIHMTTGSTRPRLAFDDIANLKVPVPTPAVQAAIAAEIRNRRDEASRLRSEGQAGWQAAKQWFEAQLL